MTKMTLITGFLLFSSLFTGDVIVNDEISPEVTPNFSEEQLENDVSGQEQVFELPISGSTGYATVRTIAKEKQNPESEEVFILNMGEAFCILREEGEYWEVLRGDDTGWIHSDYCMINLPDVLPSVIYDNKNAYESVFYSMGREIPNISGEKLYDSVSYNERLGEESFTMPILYSTAKKVAKAQENARTDGNCLVIIETYRPMETQQAVVNGMYQLLNDDEEVRMAIYSWGLTYFISTDISSHQKGFAFDVTLAKILETEERITGDFSYEAVISYEEYKMPTDIHDLCPDSASMLYPIPSTADWTKVPVSENMNESAILLQKYCTEAGFFPLSSEWWHFNDFDAKIHEDNIGLFLLTDVVSCEPIYG